MLALPRTTILETGQREAAKTRPGHYKWPMREQCKVSSCQGSTVLAHQVTGPQYSKQLTFMET